MGRLLILIGVLMVGAGFILPFVTTTNIPGLSSVNTIINPTAAEFCNAGEQLVTTHGASGRTNSSDTTTGSVTYYYCENSAGERREVTDAINNNIIGGVGNIMGSIGSVFSGALATVGMSVAGIALIIVGVLMATRGSRKPRQVMFGVQSPTNNSPIGTPPNQPQQPYINYNAPGFGSGHDANSVVNFVRDQLDAAYRNGQISREDYDRAIEKMSKR